MNFKLLLVIGNTPSEGMITSLVQSECSFVVSRAFMAGAAR